MLENKKRLNVKKFLEFMEGLEETERVRMSLIALNEIFEDCQKGVAEGLNGEVLVPAFLAMDEYILQKKSDEFSDCTQPEGKDSE